MFFFPCFFSHILSSFLSPTFFASFSFFSPHVHYIHTKLYSSYAKLKCNTMHKLFYVFIYIFFRSIIFYDNTFLVNGRGASCITFYTNQFFFFFQSIAILVNASLTFTDLFINESVRHYNQ